jgi:carboxypeptidase C (cathepsin A)
MRYGSILAAAAIALMPVAAAAQIGKAAPIPLATDGPLAPVTTHHQIATAHGTLAYAATWSETVLKDAAGTPQATISATSYVLDGVKAPAQRPVIVLFNGGPGASSSPLQFSAFGPRILGPKDAAGNRAMIDNPDTLLDAGDLVFIDPVGTGFSRPLREGGGKPYWSVEGDEKAALTLVRAWLAANGRTASPLYIAGESYGGYRLGAMARDMGDLNVAGMILISPALDFGGTADQSAIDSLPTMAVAAWYHGKAKDGRTVDQVWSAAHAFAQSDYAVALQQGSALAPAERDRVAARVAALIGLPVEQVAAANLRVDKQAFLEALVPGSVVGRLDVRVTAPKARPTNPDRPAAANDPSLGLGRSNVIVSKPIGDYFRTELKVPTTRDYYSLTLDVNFSWNWQRAEPLPGAGWNVAGNIAKLMQAKPASRLMLVGGYYDLTVPLAGPRYEITHSAIPLDRVTMAALPTGHSPFDGKDLADGSRRVHAFVAGQPAR